MQGCWQIGLFARPLTRQTAVIPEHTNTLSQPVRSLALPYSLASLHQLYTIPVRAILLAGSQNHPLYNKCLSHIFIEKCSNSIHIHPLYTHVFRHAWKLCLNIPRHADGCLVRPRRSALPQRAPSVAKRNSCAEGGGYRLRLPSDEEWPRFVHALNRYYRIICLTNRWTFFARKKRYWHIQTYASYPPHKRILNM